jgi:S1-C subfamily serine protease
MNRSLAIPSAALLLLAGNVRGQADETVYEKALPATVWVVNAKKGSTGTGALVDARRKLVVTNYHVVEDSARVSAFFPCRDEDGEVIAERSYYVEQDNVRALFRRRLAGPAEVVARDPGRDLALLQLFQVPPDVLALPLAAAGARPGQNLHSIGNGGLGDALWVYTPGKVRQVRRRTFTVADGTQKVTARVVESTSPVNPGDSGGPVLNDRGELAALVQSANPQSQAWSTFIDVREIRALLKSYRGPSEEPAPRPKVVVSAPAPAK